MLDEQNAGSSTATSESPESAYRAIAAQYADEGETLKAEPAPATQETSESTDTTPSDNAASDPAKPKPKRPDRTKEDTERRFQELLNKNKILSERLEQVEARSKPAPAKEAEALKRPVIEDFSSHGEKAWEMFEAAKEEYYEKKAELREAAAVKKALEAYETQQVERKQKEEFASIADKWNKQVAAERQADEDYDAVAFNPEMVVTDAMVSFCLESEVGAKVMKHLGTDLDECERISKLPPTAMVKALTLIEAGIAEKPKPKTPPPAGKKLTAAPPPPAELSGRRGADGTGDESMDALARGDFRAFDAAENRKAGIRH